MSFYTGTQTELLYAMPATGPTVTAAAATICSGTTAANPPYGLPAGFFGQNSGAGPGKSLLIKGGGRYTVGSTAVTDTRVGAIDKQLKELGYKGDKKAKASDDGPTGRSSKAKKTAEG